MYTPDRWVLLKIAVDNDTIYKVFGMWSGGYLDGDSWRFNSGVTSITVGDNFEIYGLSGSCYHCSTHNYGLTGYGSGILDSFMKRTNAISIVDEDDILNIFAEINNE